jgi:hypothetical protein
MKTVTSLTRYLSWPVLQSWQNRDARSPVQDRHSRPGVPPRLQSVQPAMMETVFKFGTVVPLRRAWGG